MNARNARDTIFDEPRWLLTAAEATTRLGFQARDMLWARYHLLRLHVTPGESHDSTSGRGMYYYPESYVEAVAPYLQKFSTKAPPIQLFTEFANSERLTRLTAKLVEQFNAEAALRTTDDNEMSQWNIRTLYHLSAPAVKSWFESDRLQPVMGQGMAENLSKHKECFADADAVLSQKHWDIPYLAPVES